METTAPPPDGWADRGRSSPVVRLVKRMPYLGIRRCLFAAFAGITGMMVVASGVSLLSYVQFGRTLNGITVETMPAVEASLRVARTSAEIAATAPALVAATRIEEMAPVLTTLLAKQSQLATTINLLKGTPAGGAAVQDLVDYAAAMNRQLDAIAATVEARLSVSQDREKALALLEESHRGLLEALAPLVDDAAFDVSTALIVEQGQDLSSVRDKLTRISNDQFDLLQKLDVLRGESNLLFGLLTTAATTPRKEQFVPLRDSVTAAIRHIDRSFDLIKHNDRVASIGPKLAALEGFAQGPNNVFDLRGRELDAGMEAQRILAANRDLVDHFSAAVDTVVTRSEADALSAATNAATTIVQARRVLVGTTEGGLLIAFAVGWFYVGRRVVRRLALLRQSMLAIAGGDLTTEVPQSGNDEISEMAKAVQVFKENKIEADRLTAELHKAQSELLHNERLSTLGRLTSMVAHELRNPLSAIRNTVFALREIAAGAGLDVDRPLARMDRNIQRCNRIITDLLEFTHNRDLNPIKIEADPWLEDVLNAQPIPDTVTLRCAFGAAGHAHSFDPERLRRVVVNLIENAVQAMADPTLEERSITVSTTAASAGYEIAIADTGPGIPGDVLTQVFEPLFSTKSFGTGLGLPTVKQIVSQHGGTVEIESRPGTGTTVTVRLPNEAAEKLAA
jgi:signal transduction histidine kinase